MALAAIYVRHGDLPMPVFALALLLLTLPLAYALLTTPLERPRDEIAAISLIALSATLPRYIFALTGASIAGTDAPFHIYQTQLFLTGAWPDQVTISNALPLLYAGYALLSRAFDVPVTTLALWWHPILNVLTIPMLYVFLRRVTSRTTAALAAWIYGWEYTNFFFGYEYRTQSLAIFLLVAYLATRSLIDGSGSRSWDLAPRVAGYALLVLIGLTAIAPAVLATLVLAVLAAGERCDRQISSHRRIFSLAAPLVIAGTTGISLTLFGALDAVALGVWNMVHDTVTLQRLTTSELRGVYVAGYGPFVAALQWAMRVLFLAGLVLAIRDRRRGGGPPLSIIVATGVLLTLFSLLTLLGSPLSPGRYFQFLTPFYGLMAAIAIVGLGRVARRERRGSGLTSIAVALLIGLWCLSGMLKLPAAVIDPRRADQPASYLIMASHLDAVERLRPRLADGSAYVCAEAPLHLAVTATTGVTTSTPFQSLTELRACLASPSRGAGPTARVVIWSDDAAPFASVLDAAGFREVGAASGARLWER